MQVEARGTGALVTVKLTGIIRHLGGEGGGEPLPHMVASSPQIFVMNLPVAKGSERLWWAWGK